MRFDASKAPSLFIREPHIRWLRHLDPSSSYIQLLWRLSFLLGGESYGDPGGTDTGWTQVEGRAVG